MKNYSSEQRARSFLVIGSTAFLAIMSTVFILTGITKDSVFGFIIGFPLACITFYALYSVLAGGKVSISVESGVLTYTSTSWPKRNIRFSLSDVVHIQVRDDSLRSRFTLKDKSVYKIGWVGVAYKFRDYIKSEFPSIEVEYIEGSS